QGRLPRRQDLERARLADGPACSALTPHTRDIAFRRSQFPSSESRENSRLPIEWASPPDVPRSSHRERTERTDHVSKPSGHLTCQNQDMAARRTISATG